MQTCRHAMGLHDPHRLFYYEWNQRHDAGFFDGGCQSPLVLGACPVSFRRVDFALGIGETFDQIDIFEIYFVHFYVAKMANFLLGFRGFVVVIYPHSAKCRGSETDGSETGPVPIRLDVRECPHIN